MCDQHCECVCESALPNLPPDFEAMDSFPLFGPRVDTHQLERIERTAHLARRVLKAADDISKTDPHPGKHATILLDLAGEFEKETTRDDLKQLAGTDPESIAKQKKEIQEHWDETRRQWDITRAERIKDTRGLFQGLKPDDVPVALPGPPCQQFAIASQREPSEAEWWEPSQHGHRS